MEKRLGLCTLKEKRKGRRQNDQNEARRVEERDLEK